MMATHPARPRLAPCSPPSRTLRAAGRLRRSLTAAPRAALTISGRDEETPLSRTRKHHFASDTAILQRLTDTTGDRAQARYALRPEPQAVAVTTITIIMPKYRVNIPSLRGSGEENISFGHREVDPSQCHYYRGSVLAKAAAAVMAGAGEDLAQRGAELMGRNPGAASGGYHVRGGDPARGARDC